MPLQSKRLARTIERAHDHPARVAQIISLNERRASTRDERVHRTPHASLSSRAVNAMQTFALVTLLAAMWPVAKMAGVFAWSDGDERE